VSLTREELTPESELETSTWQAMERHRVTCPEPLAFQDAVLLAAKAYAAGDSEQLAEMRRAVLARPKLSGFASVSLCDFCRDAHFRSSPIERSNACLKIPCQCWCGDRDDKPLEVD